MIKAGVYSFDSELKTCLSTDYSKDGMGWILQLAKSTLRFPVGHERRLAQPTW